MQNNNNILLGYHTQRDFLNYLMLRFGKQYAISTDNEDFLHYKVFIDLELLGIKVANKKLIPRDFEKRVFKLLGLMIIININKEFKFIKYIKQKKVMSKKNKLYLYLDFICDKNYKNSYWYTTSEKDYLPYIQEFSNFEVIDKFKEKV